MLGFALRLTEENKAEVTEKEGKKKTKKNKIGTVFLVSILALAGVGVSFAGFSDIINVYGSVSTATVEFEITYSGTWVYKIWDLSETPTDPPGTPDVYDVEKEVLIYRGLTDSVPTEQQVIDWAASNNGYASLEAEAYATDGTNDYDVDVVYDNLFPCINFKADIVAHYIGSIPAKVTISEPVWSSGGDIFDDDLIFDFSYYVTEGNSLELPHQMHYCDTLTIDIAILLPQDNDFQGNSGAFSFDIKAIQWNDECDEGQFPGKTVLVPDTCTMEISHPYEETGISAYWKTTISNFNPPQPDGYYNVEEGETYLGWCIDFETTIGAGTYNEVQMFSTYPGDEPWLPGELDEVAWQRINYIINHKESSDEYPEWKCVTWAIWYFVNGGSHPTIPDNYIPGTYPGSITDVENMIDNANANPDWIPGEGDFVGVIMYKPGKQVTIIEVDP